MMKSRIVSGVGVSANLGPTSRSSREMVMAIELAMSQAVTDAYADGVSDPKEHSKRMADARDRVRNEYLRLTAD